MSVNRNTPKFADRPHAHSLLNQDMTSSTFKASNASEESFQFDHSKENNDSSRTNPRSNLKESLKASLNKLKQLKKAETDQTKIEKLEFNDKKSEGENSESFDTLERDSNNTMGLDTRRDRFNAIANQNNDEEAIRPHSLSWRAASQDAQSRLLKEGSTQKGTRWPTGSLLNNLETLYNKPAIGNKTATEMSKGREILNRYKALASSRKITGLNDSINSFSQSNQEERLSRGSLRSFYSERETSKSKKDTRSSYSSYTSSRMDQKDSKVSKEVEKLRIEAKKKKSAMKGKLDLINNLFEELHLQPREKPVLPSDRPKSPEIEARETPRPLRLVVDSDSRRKENISRKSATREPIRNKFEMPSKQFIDKENIPSTHTQFPKQALNMQAQEADFEEDEGIDENSGRKNDESFKPKTQAHEEDEKENDEEIEDILRRNEENFKPKTLVKEEEETNEIILRGNEESHQPKIQVEEEENNENAFRGNEKNFEENAEESSENSFNEISNLSDKIPLNHILSKKLGNMEINDENSGVLAEVQMNRNAGIIKRQGLIQDLTPMKENTRPPLPAKKAKYIRVGTIKGDEENSLNFSEQKDPYLQVTKEKNYLELNKTSSATKSKKHKDYEKILKNIDQACKPILDTLKKVSSNNSNRYSSFCSENKSSSLWSPNSTASNSIQVDNTLGGFGNTANSIKSFYEEMNNLTLKLTEAASMMQKTLDRLDVHKTDGKGEHHF